MAARPPPTEEGSGRFATRAALTSMQTTKPRVLRTAAAALLLLALGACGVAPHRGEEPAAVRAAVAKAQSLSAANQYAGAAAAYETAAAASAPADAAGFYLQAAAAWWQSGDEQRTRAATAKIDLARLTAAERVRLSVLQARMDLHDQRPLDAYQRLAALPTSIPEDIKPDVLEVRARAQFQLGRPVAAIETLRQRANALSGADARLANQHLIWRGLIQTTEELPPDSALGGVDAETRGWIALARIGRTAWQEPYRFADRIHAWEQDHPDHPAVAALIPDLLAAHAQSITYPPQVALLLPLSGPYQAVGEAIRDGFLAARYQNRRGTASSIRVYDTAGGAQAALDAYRRALADGAALVVGPLTKAAVSSVAQADQDTAVPVLALNRLEDDGAGPERFYQFGLAPEDEAAQVADRVIQDGLTQGVALVPDNDWGHRLLEAFSQRLQGLGGTLLTAQTYTPDVQDFSTPIMRMLNLDASKLRTQTLEATLGVNLVFEPRRRQDVQFIFLAARASQAQLIGPQLRFHHALTLPVYATSDVYRPEAGPDRDLDGIRFTDMPWSIAPDASVEAIRAQLDRLWPDTFQRSSRLYALGYDAYRLIPLIHNLKDPLSEAVRGVTGVLSIDSDRRIHRTLDWAVFRRGAPVALPPPSKTAPQDAVPDDDGQ